jgi:hypothetical protein
MRARLIALSVALIALSIAAVPADAAPKKAQVRFSATAYSVPESQSDFTVHVLRSGNTRSTATVQLSVDGSTTATSGDFSTTPALPATVTFVPGDNDEQFTVHITDNLTVNPPNKFIVFRLGSPSANTQIKTATTKVTIVDNEGPGTLDFSSSTYSVVEGAGLATITVNRIGATNLRVSVDYATNAVGSTATGVTDYTPITPAQTLTFEAGEVSKTFQIALTDDALAESPETINVVLSNQKNLTTPASPPQLGPNSSPGPAVLTINDDDVSTYSFQSSLFSVNENDAAGHATITVLRGGATNIPSSVSYSTSDGTAASVADYTPATGTIDFAAGETTKTFDVTISNDGTAEANETVNLALGLNATTVATSQLSIIDNDNPKASVQFSDVAYSVDEDAGTATVTVTLSHAVDADVTVDYATSDGTAMNGVGQTFDYTATSGTLTFIGNTNNGGTGQTQKTFTIAITDDPDPEDPETINLALTNASPTGSAVAGAPSSATLTIADDDPAGNLEFESLSYSATEASGMATVTVHRIGGSSGPVTIDYTTSDGSAKTTDSDYTATSGTLSFADGQTSKTFVVPITWDARAEGPETINLELTNAIGADLANNDAATLKVADDGASGPLQFSSNSYSVGEAGDLVTVTVTRSGGSLGGGVNVDYATSDDSAKAGSDYTATNGTLTFAPGEVTRSFTVAVANDSVASGSRAFNVILSNVTGGATLGTPASANVTITDDDTAPVIPGSGTDTDTAPAPAPGTSDPAPQSTPSNPNPGGSQTAVADKTAPKITLTAKKIQKALKAKVIKLTLKCSENCKFTLTAKTGKGRKAITLGKVTKNAAKGAKVTVKVKLSKKTLAKLVKALKNGKAKVTISVVAKDATGNAGKASRAVTVKR